MSVRASRRALTLLVAPALVLVLATTTAAAPSPTAAATHKSGQVTPAFQTALADDGPTDDPKPGPVPELSTETSNTVRNEDGTYTAKVYSSPVNYQDDGGDWVPISNDLVEAPGSTYAVQNEANSYTVSIPENPATTPVQFATDDAWVKMKLAGSDSDSPDVDGSEAKVDVAGASSVVYEAQDSGVKESITLDAPPAEPVSYRYALTVSPGTTPVLTSAN